MKITITDRDLSRLLIKIGSEFQSRRAMNYLKRYTEERKLEQEEQKKDIIEKIELYKNELRIIENE